MRNHVGHVITLLAYVEVEVNGYVERLYRDVKPQSNNPYLMSNIKRCKEGASKHNTLLRCNVSQDRQHVSALYYKAIIRSDK